MSNEVHTVGEPSVTSLVSGIVRDAQELIKQQAALVRTEIREDFRKTKKAALLLVCGALAALPAALLLCFALVYLLHWSAPALELWAWFLIVGGAIGVASSALIYSGVKRFQSFSPLPDESVAALRENLRWRTNPR
jgi:hypothetical protein